HTARKNLEKKWRDACAGSAYALIFSALKKNKPEKNKPFPVFCFAVSAINQFLETIAPSLVHRKFLHGMINRFD
ncbi:MAG TPA: hypothetical protein PKA52_12690, partial [bacterium]|nr:hypothetical protein [bacterium]